MTLPRAVAPGYTVTSTVPCPAELAVHWGWSFRPARATTVYRRAPGPGLA